MKNRLSILMVFFVILFAGLLGLSSVEPFATINGAIAQAGDSDTTYEVITNMVYLPCIFRNFCAKMFTDDFSSPGSGWPIGDDGNVRYEYVDGEYSILVRNAFTSTVADPGFKASNFIAEVDVQMGLGGTGTQGLVFGLSEDGEQFYTFDIQRPGYFGIQRHDPNPPYWTVLISGSSEYIDPGAFATNRLKVGRNGPVIDVYANGQLLTSVEDGNYIGERTIGLIVTSSSGNDARFDNFIAQDSNCSP